MEVLLPPFHSRTAFFLLADYGGVTSLVYKDNADPQQEEGMSWYSVMSLLTALFTVIFAAQAKTRTVCQLSERRTYKDFILTDF